MRKLLACVAAVFVVVALDVGFQLQAGEVEGFRVGAVFSLSGEGSLLGDPAEKTVELLTREINVRGGIKGRPLQLILRDDESDRRRCAAIVRELIEKEDVLAVVGPSLSDTSMEVVPIAEETRTVLISCGASYKIVTASRETGEQFKWVFKTAQSDSLAVQCIYSHMKQRGISRVAILTAETQYGESGREELLRLAPAFGISIVASETYPSRDNSLQLQFQRIRDVDHQAIVNWSVGPSQIVAVHKWRESGMSVMPLYQSHGFGSPRNVALSGSSGEGVMCPLGACTLAPSLPVNHPQKTVTMQYWKAYEKAYGEPVSSFGGHAWDALSLLVDALGAVGPNKERIRDHIEFRRGFVGQHGIFNFSPVDHNGLGLDAFIMALVRDGKWTVAER
jgi:branched-chain amino acid transport system substrate-binding protein